MKKHYKIFFLFSILLIFSACQERKISPIKGTLKCYVDESLYNIVKAERDTFIVLYPESKIELVSTKAREGIAAVLNKEADLFISSRNFNDEEKSFLDKSKIVVRSFKFCFDAVVPIMRENESKKQISAKEIKDLLLGQAHDLTVFVPEHNSGVYEYLKEKLLENKEPRNISVVKNEEEVISKVKKTKRSLGFVGLNSTANVEGIKILEAGSKVRRDGEILYYKPHPAYLVTENYPFVRTTIIFVNEIGIGLASGFTTFLTSTRGQKIVLQNNLGPAAVPTKIGR